ncbi:hypothetical protein H6P81_020366 [Aristolochia fimbriata]|uniref:Mitochondrial import inner membrane translocase subunit TIM17-2-like n=1 Tax=Aristolochia fimbriata TaxID=158543 RepID=A0AAV7DXH2_ARIFI|nr:hypothetical protein H6P81_020366 [Aristolochia fimbriata]
MATPETSREPCPDRILDDLGGAFAMGAVGGSAWHFMKGVYNNPRGERILGGTQTARMYAPRTGGGFAVWGGLFSVFDCSMVYLRQKEDPWNSIIAGAATGGVLQMRQGLGSASKSAMFGGAILALIEGAGIMINKMATSVPQKFPMEEPFPGAPAYQLGYPIPAPAPPVAADSSEQSGSSWFGGFFGGGKKKQETASTGGGHTEVLESFDSSSTPIPSFEYK